MQARLGGVEVGRDVAACFRIDVRDQGLDVAAFQAVQGNAVHSAAAVVDDEVIRVCRDGGGRQAKLVVREGVETVDGELDVRVDRGQDDTDSAGGGRVVVRLDPVSETGGRQGVVNVGHEVGRRFVSSRDRAVDGDDHRVRCDSEAVLVREDVDVEGGLARQPADHGGWRLEGRDRRPGHGHRREAEFGPCRGQFIT